MSVFSKRVSVFTQLYKHSARRLSDRSFRMANVLDLKAGQDQKVATTSAHYHPFMHSSTPDYQPDLSKQLLIDVRDSESEYRGGHIPNAVFLPRSRFDFFDYVDTHGGITFDKVYRTMTEIGASDDTSEIVLYDNAGENACRLWFVLRYFGFSRVRILNGGFESAKNYFGLVDDKPVPLTPAKELSLKPSRSSILTRPAQMLADVESHRVQVIDTRSAEDFSQGAIPNAVNIPSTAFATDGCFRSVQEIRDVMRQKGFDVENNEKGPIVVYSDKRDRTASIAFFALNMVGFDRLSLYDQGFSNWSVLQTEKLSLDQQTAFGK